MINTMTATAISVMIPPGRLLDPTSGPSVGSSTRGPMVSSVLARLRSLAAPATPTQYCVDQQADDDEHYSSDDFLVSLMIHPLRSRNPAEPMCGRPWGPLDRVKKKPEQDGERQRASPSHGK